MDHDLGMDDWPPGRVGADAGWTAVVDSLARAASIGDHCSLRMDDDDDEVDGAVIIVLSAVGLIALAGGERGPLRPSPFKPTRPTPSTTGGFAATGGAAEGSPAATDGAVVRGIKVGCVAGDSCAGDASPVSQSWSSFGGARSRFSAFGLARAVAALCSDQEPLAPSPPTRIGADR